MVERKPRKVEAAPQGPEAGGGRRAGGRGKGVRRAQFNIRVEADLLEAFRDFCRRNGLDPQAQVIHFMRRVVNSEVDLQEKLWEALRGRPP